LFSDYGGGGSGGGESYGGDLAELADLSAEFA
jgi:hypothetical protein